MVKNKAGCRESKTITTSENWHPTEGGVVSVSLYKDANNSWRVAVWGADDFGLEKFGMNITRAYGTYHAVTDGSTQAWLRQIGFVNA